MITKQLTIIALLFGTPLLAIAESPSATPRRPRPERTAAERAEYLQRIRLDYERAPAEWPVPTLDTGVEHREIGPPPPPATRDPSEQRQVELGKQLFFDPRLSGSKQIACASCHDPDLGWGDGRTTSFGHNRRRLKRNAPSILNSGRRASLFWDGRAATLEQQARDVLANADEMHAADELLVEHLASVPEYVESFRAVFGVDQPDPEHAAQALAAYERTLVSSTTRFDLFARGRFTALEDDELSGLHLFRTDARCLNCHNGPLFTDDKFHNLGLSEYGRPGEDLGRFELTGEEEDIGAFRTPSLRDVSRTAPYMHNGRFELDVLLRLYNAGMPNDRPQAGHRAPTPIKSPLLKPLGLNEQDLSDLAAFLRTLEEPRRRVEPPQLPAGL